MEIKIILEQFQKNQIYSFAQPLWNDIEYLLLPIENENEMVSYHDSFLDIKAEVEKISDIQIDKVEDGAKYLCQNVGKDIRVAVYYSYALFRKEGYSGLIKGLMLLYGIIALFPESYQPRKPNVINNILAWLSGDKIENIILLSNQSLSDEEYNTLTVLLSLIEICLSEQYESKFETLQSLAKILPARQSSQQHTTETEEKTSKPVIVPNDDMIIHSSQDLINTMKTVCQFLIDKNNTPLAAYRLIRQFRWDTLQQLPLHQDLVTKIVAPRSELINKLESIYQRKSWEELLEQCHYAFLEASNHFWLDLQYLSWQAMKNLGDQYAIWADMLSSDLAYLLDRLPNLEAFSFQNNLAFSSPPTLDWLDENARFKTSHLEQVQSSGPSLLAMEATEEEAFAILQEQGLAQALTWLDTVYFTDDLQQYYQKQYLIAKLAIKENKTDFAIHLLEKISMDFSEDPLFSWDKQLTFMIKNDLLKLLQKKYKTANQQERHNQIDRLQKELVLLNPNLAHQILY